MLNNLVTPIATTAAASAEPIPTVGMDSLYELAVGGGPLMVPIAVCSVVALAFTVERWIRLRPSFLGTRTFGRSVLSTMREDGVPAALEMCERKQSPMSRVLSAGLRRADEPFLDREKAVEDTASSEMRRLSSNLQPLVLVYLIAPLLGLLGTVWGMIEAFSSIALKEGLGQPELLAAGIYQALTTTAAGLAVAIPAIVAYHYLKGRIDRFARTTEDLYRTVDENLTSAKS